MSVPSSASTPFTPVRSRWSSMYPQHGYRHVSVRDLRAPVGTCSMCSKDAIRYEHTITHDETGCTLVVGRCCAQRLTGDIDTPFNAEKRAKQIAAARDSWPTAWRQVVESDYWLASDPHVPRYRMRKAEWMISAHQYTLDYGHYTEVTPEMPTPWILRFKRRVDGKWKPFFLADRFATFDEARARAFEVAFVDPSVLEPGDLLHDVLGEEVWGEMHWHMTYYSGCDDARRGCASRAESMTGHQQRRYAKGYADGLVVREAEAAESVRKEVARG